MSASVTSLSCISFDTANLDSFNLLGPGVVVVLEDVLDLNLLVAADSRGVAVLLAEASKQRCADAPLVAGRTAPGVAAGPLLKSRLDEVASAVAHSWPEEELAGLRRRGRAGQNGGDGMLDGGSSRSERNGTTPGVLALEEGLQGVVRQGSRKGGDGEDNSSTHLGYKCNECMGCRIKEE